MRHHEDQPQHLPKTIACPKFSCTFTTTVTSNTLRINKIKSFTQHYISTHNIKRYVCRYCIVNFTLLSDAYIHLAEAHPSYPIDIVEREYKQGCQITTEGYLSEGHFENLRRIRDESTLCEQQKKAAQQQIPKQKVNKPVVLNSLLGLKGATAAMSAITTKSADVLPIDKTTTTAPLDEPLVNIETDEFEEVAGLEEDPLSLENEGSVVPVVTTVSGQQQQQQQQVDSDASSLNFDTVSVSNVR